MATSKPVTAKKQSTPEKKAASPKAAAKPIKLGGVPNQGTVTKKTS